jgi:VanZ family protein
VSKARSFLKYWLPVLVWMAVVYSASADTKSVQHSRIIAPILRWLFPHISEDTVNFIVLVVRKGAHLTEYAILGLLLWRALRKPIRDDARSWSWRTAGWAVLVAALYASSDELHQLFVPTREASVRDVLIDTTGAALGLLLLWGIGRVRKWWMPAAGQGRPVSPQ